MLTQLVVLFMRGYALWLGLQALRSFGVILEIDSVKLQSAAAMIGLGAVELGVAMVLWFFPFTIAKRLCPPHEVADFSGLTPGGLYSAGMILMGVYWISGGVYETFYWVVRFALSGRDRNGVPIEGPDLLSIIMTATDIAVGLFLILGRHGIKNAILRFRHGNHDRDDF